MMTAAQLRTSALNLRNRAKAEDNKERAAAWLKEADEYDAAAAALDAQAAATAPVVKKEPPAKTPTK